MKHIPNYIIILHACTNMWLHIPPLGTTIMHLITLADVMISSDPISGALFALGPQSSDVPKNWGHFQLGQPWRAEWMRMSTTELPRHWSTNWKYMNWFLALELKFYFFNTENSLLPSWKRGEVLRGHSFLSKQDATHPSRICYILELCFPTFKTKMSFLSLFFLAQMFRCQGCTLWVWCLCWCLAQDSQTKKMMKQ